MKSYNTFAKFYDELTDNVEYEKRSKYIYDFFKENCAICNKNNNKRNIQPFNYANSYYSCNCFFYQKCYIACNKLKYK